MLGEIPENQVPNTSSIEELSSKHFVPLQIACDSKIPRLMDIAIDAIHYMMEHGYFRGSWLTDSIEDDKSKPKNRFGMLINTICSCAEETDDTVQLQVCYVMLCIFFISFF